MNKYYAGIGSRSTPPETLIVMGEIAEKLGTLGYILRSGHAGGADLAFERGAPKAQILLPWKNFNTQEEPLAERHEYIIPRGEDKEAIDSVFKFHPAPHRLSQGALKLMSRNYRQIVGDPNSSFVVCWTEGGKLIGGTAQAIKIANSFNIPVFNLFNVSKEEVLLYAIGEIVND